MKIYLDVQQGTAQWHRLRLGKPTASCADQIITPKTMEFSKSARKYAFRLLAERLLNESGTVLDGLQYLERGKELEPAAVSAYEFMTDNETVPVGFITTDDGRVGASPDRLIVGPRAGCEFKAPSAAVHLQYLMDGAAPEYVPQVQCQLWVCEFDYVDFFSYHPRCPNFLLRTPRNEAFIAKIQDGMDRFHDMLDDMERRARELGVFQEFAEVALPVTRDGQEAVDGPFAEEFLTRAAERMMAG